MELDMEDPPRPSDFKAFFNSAEYSDLTIISSDGREYKAHRVVLANLSPELNELVSQAEHGFVQFEEPGNVVEMLLQWCYGVEWPAATHRNVVVADFEILADVMDATSRDKADLFEIALDLYRCQIQRVRTMMMVLRRTLTAAEADVDDLKTVLQAEGQGGNRS